MAEGEQVVEVIVRVRGFGHEDQVERDVISTLANELYLEFGDRFSILRHVGFADDMEELVFNPRAHAKGDKDLVWMTQPPSGALRGNPSADHWRLLQVSSVEDPFDPRCGRHARDIDDYDTFILEATEVGPVTAAERIHYVQSEEGTFNPTNGHFLCDKCYIAEGQPSSPTGWKCP